MSNIIPFDCIRAESVYCAEMCLVPSNDPNEPGITKHGQMTFNCVYSNTEFVLKTFHLDALPGESAAQLPRHVLTRCCGARGFSFSDGGGIQLSVSSSSCHCVFKRAAQWFVLPKRPSRTGSQLSITTLCRSLSAAGAHEPARTNTLPCAKKVMK